MHVAVHLDIRPSNGAIHVLHSRSPELAHIPEVAHAYPAQAVSARLGTAKGSPISHSHLFSIVYLT